MNETVTAPAIIPLAVIVEEGGPSVYLVTDHLWFDEKAKLSIDPTPLSAAEIGIKTEGPNAAAQVMLLFENDKKIAAVPAARLNDLRQAKQIQAGYFDDGGELLAARITLHGLH
jgi:hypothetical protein